MSRGRQVALAAALYGAASVVLFGRGVVTHPQTAVVGDEGADKTLYMWAFAWWPHALRALHNPLDVTVAWMPHGFDLGLGTAGGGLALLAWPIASVGGLVLAYNVLALAAPALGATTAFLLCRSVTERFGPSLVGGWVFGFSSYELGHLLGHLPLAFVALVPLVPWLVLLRARGVLGRARFAGLLAGVLTLEFLIVTQVFFSLVLVGAVAAVLARVVVGRSTLRLAAESAVAVGLATLLVSPILVYAVAAHAAAPARSPFAESADVLNFVVPTRRTWLHTGATDAIAARFTGTGAELGAYLGLPLLVLVVLAARRHRLLAVLLAAVAVLSLGTRVKIAGAVVGVGPWAVLARLPVVGSALPVRLTLYASLLAGVLVALALAESSTRLCWALALCGIAATLPNLQLPTWSSPVPQPTLFAGAHAARAIPRGSTVLALPYGPAGWSMLWQAESGFRFALVGGHFALRVTPQERRWQDVYLGINGGRVTPRRLRAFLAAHRVDEIVVAPGARPGARRLVRVVGGTGRTFGDTTLYRVGGRPPGTP
jgi:hypothetical protein